MLGDAHKPAPPTAGGGAGLDDFMGGGAAEVPPVDTLAPSEPATGNGTSGLVVPIAMWGRRAPTHCVTVLYLLRDQRTLVTGSADGQVLSCNERNIT